MRRSRKAKIIATLGPSSNSLEMIEKLVLAGADVFRLNFSHGAHAEHRERMDIIREVERKHKRPLGVLMDLQGPKLRVGKFGEGRIRLEKGDNFRLDLSDAPGGQERVNLPHPEIFAAIKVGTNLLLDDGKINLKVTAFGKDWADTEVLVGGALSNHKGLNVPNVILPLSPLTDKDRADLEYGLEIGADWVALSFVQRPEDVIEARRLIAGRAALLSKLEKPSAIDFLQQIIDHSDAVMVARGDLGVEVPPQTVPTLQKRIIRQCRAAGKPVVVATQMLDSMVSAPTPTRAEASDVATAVYDGADAVMLSAETAAGQFPLEAVTIMDRIIEQVEGDEQYHRMIEASRDTPMETDADAISAAARQAANSLKARAVVTYTSSGSTAYRAARERPDMPILCLTSDLSVARRMSLVWGLHTVRCKEISTFSEMVKKACRIAKREELATEPEDRLVITAGVPYGTPGTTNILRIARVCEGQLDDPVE
ncbi:MAG: pyruvate kinase [Alphaproteobacteria bacterium RIFOXYD12_FULL_60_8]|nr:MAG: pyruvate kinase [Alphaproteobacteria bacterium RIFOXYD12_FULL_60_8]